MKKIFFTLLTIFSFTQLTYGQTDQQLISDIEKLRLQTISNLSNYQKTTEIKDTFGFRYVYKNGKELKLVSIASIEKNIDKRVSWYFNNGQFIYTEQIWIDNQSNNIINHEKLYASNGRLLSWIKTDGSEINSSSDDFKNAEKQLNAFTQKDLENYSSK